jgi:hypothetical protein
MENIPTEAELIAETELIEEDKVEKEFYQISGSELKKIIVDILLHESIVKNKNLDQDIVRDLFQHMSHNSMLRIDMEAIQHADNYSFEEADKVCYVFDSFDYLYSILSFFNFKLDAGTVIEIGIPETIVYDVPVQGKEIELIEINPEEAAELEAI